MKFTTVNFRRSYGVVDKNERGGPALRKLG
jgi:hypothetical protein